MADNYRKLNYSAASINDKLRRDPEQDAELSEVKKKILDVESSVTNIFADVNNSKEYDDYNI